MSAVGNANPRDASNPSGSFSARTAPGVRRSHREIAAYCGCTYGAIWMIEQKALHKLKKRLFMRNDPELAELVVAVVGRVAFDSEKSKWRYLSA